MSTRTTFQDRVTVEVSEHVAQVVLTRPEKRNALDRPMFEGIAGAVAWLADLAATSDLRAVVLSGAGHSFCAGIDTTLVATTVGTPEDLAPRTHGLANIYQQAAWGWRTLAVPVIAAVHGVAFGGGLQIMLGADIRIVAPDARLSVMEIRYGLIPDMAGIARMVTLCRDDRVRELTFTGREVSGEEAVAYGLATQVDSDPLARATKLAAEIAQKDPAAIRAAKRLFNLAQDRAADVILEAEAAEQAPLLAAAVRRMSGG